MEGAKTPGTRGVENRSFRNLIVGAGSMWVSLDALGFGCSVFAAVSFHLSLYLHRGWYGVGRAAPAVGSFPFL